MYKVYCGSDPLELNTNDVTLISAELKLADNEAGELTFQISPTHPYVDSIVNRVSIIYVYQDGEEIWRGTPIEITTDFFGVKKVVCQGELNYLVDSIQPPAEYHFEGTGTSSVRAFLETLINKHNAAMSPSDAHKIFRVGAVTVKNPDQIIYRYTNWENTLEDILDKLVDRLGGHLRIRHVKEGNTEVNYLDYLEDFPRVSDQVVRFGHNLLDYSQDYDLNEIITRIIPLGATLEESPIDALDAYTTIESVNNGKVYLQNDAAVQRYGIITRVVTWDDVNVPSILKTKAQQYLNKTVYDNICLEVNAVDLSNMGADVNQLRLLDEVRVISTPHGMDTFFPITKMDINLKSPSENTLTMGISTRMTLTQSTSSIETKISAELGELPTKREILEEAKENATQLITSGALGSHVVVLPDEIYVMDTDDPETARKVWRWNVNGLGYSSAGVNGQYGLAMTMDGQIVADVVATGALTDTRGLNYWDLDTGEFSLSANAKVGGRTVQTIADMAVDAQTQQTVFNKLTNNGQTQGIYLQNGKIYINGNYINTYTLTTNNAILKNELKCYHEAALGGYIGYMSGSTLTRVTDGIGVSEASGLNYFIATDSGCRMTHNGSNGVEGNSSSVGVYSGRVSFSADNGVFSNADFRVNGDFSVSGEKSRIVSTDNYRDRLLYAYEMSAPMFGDIGEGTLDETGECVVDIDDLFSESINKSVEYQVFLQKEGEGDLWVTEKANSYFLVNGTPRLKFAWEVKAKQLGYEMTRMEESEEIPENPEDQDIDDIDLDYYAALYEEEVA